MTAALFGGPKLALFGASLFLLAACDTAGGSSVIQENRPPRADARGEGVDGLSTGHRLMAAGEYDLALRAYLRAASEEGVTVDVLSAIGSANLQLGRLGQAEQILRRALERDGRFVPALNNLGVVLMEKGNAGEARVIFQQAYALDSGETDAIRENLRLAIAQSESTLYDSTEEQEKPRFTLVRRGQGQYELLSRY